MCECTRFNALFDIHSLVISKTSLSSQSQSIAAISKMRKDKDFEQIKITQSE